jgi:hypothetical protein
MKYILISAIALSGCVHGVVQDRVDYPDGSYKVFATAHYDSPFISSAQPSAMLCRDVHVDNRDVKTGITPPALVGQKKAVCVDIPVVQGTASGLAQSLLQDAVAAALIRPSKVTDVSNSYGGNGGSGGNGGAGGNASAHATAKAKSSAKAVSKNSNWNDNQGW